MTKTDSTFSCWQDICSLCYCCRLFLFALFYWNREEGVSWNKESQDTKSKHNNGKKRFMQSLSDVEDCMIEVQDINFD